MKCKIIFLGNLKLDYDSAWMKIKLNQYFSIRDTILFYNKIK